MNDVNLTSALSKITIPDPVTTGETSEARSEAEEKTEENLVVTTTGGTSAASTVSDAASMTAMTQQVKSILDTYSTRTSSSSNVLVDIYSIMSLLQQTAQKLRDAMREMRQLELTVIQKQISNEAATLKAAAYTQLAAGIATFAVQCGVTLGGVAQQISSINKLSNASTAEGVDVAKQQSNLAKAGLSPETATKNVESTGQQLTAEQKTAIDGDFLKSKATATHNQLAAQCDTAKAELNALTKGQPVTVDTKAEVTKAAQTVQTAENKVATAEAKVNEAKAQVTEATDKVKTAQTKYDAAKSEADAASAKLHDVQCDPATLNDKKTGALNNNKEVYSIAKEAAATANSNKANKALTSAQGELELAQQGLSTANETFQSAQLELSSAKTDLTAAQGTLESATNLDTAQQKVLTTSKALADSDKALGYTTQQATTDTEVVAKYQNNYDKALAARNAELETTGKVSPATEEKLTTAKNELLYARAQQVENLSLNKYADSGSEAKLGSLARTLSDDLKGRQMSANADAGKLTKVMVWGQAIQNISQALGTLGTSIGSTLSKVMEAKSKQIQSDEKASEEQLEQIKDMYSSMQTTIQAVLQLFQSVVSAESNSISEIAGAIRA